MPADGTLTGNVLSLVSPSQIRVRCLDERWQEKPGPPAGDTERTDVRFEYDKRTADVRLSIELNRPQQQSWSVVERAWTQTWLHGSLRVDRVVLHLSTNRDLLALLLPGEIESSRIEVMVDNRRVDTASLSGSRLVVPVSSKGEAASHTIELRYELPLAPSRFGQHDLNLVDFEDDVWLRRSYWELVLPEDRHLAAGPVGWLNENVLRRRGAFWLPQASRSQQQMEAWVGTEAQAETPEGVRRYLYRSTNSSTTATVRTLGLSMIVLVASGFSLLLGFIVLYAKWARKAGALFVIFLIAATLAMRFPIAAALFAQAAVLGFVLVGAGAFLQRLLERQVVVPYTAAESSIIERSTTEFYDTGGDPPSHGSTAMAPIAMELTGSESKA